MHAPRVAILAVVVVAGAAPFGCNAISGVGDFEVVGPVDGASVDSQTGDSPRDAAIDTGDASLDGGSESDAPGDSLPPGDAAADQSCPGTASPTSVPVNDQYCIDSTEVTNADYAQFLASTGGDAGTQPSYCSWNTSVTPSMGWPPAPGHQNQPVTSVDWCDAFAYCQWAGKRLCGLVGGGPWSNHSSEVGDQWFQACSAEATRTYPYGNTYVPVACNGGDLHANGVIDVASLTTCVGGVPGLYDMSGNVSEWQDGCDQSTGMNDNCPIRGGNYTSNVAGMTCAWNATTQRRNQATGNVGFRCCAP